MCHQRNDLVMQHRCLHIDVKLYNSDASRPANSRELVKTNISALESENIDLKITTRNNSFILVLYQDSLTYLLTYFLTSLLPCLLPYFLTSLLTSLLPYLLPYFLTYFLTSLLTSLLPYFLTYFLTSLLTSLLTSILPYFLTYFLTSLLPYFLTYFLTYFHTSLLPYLLTYLLTYFCTYSSIGCVSESDAKLEDDQDEEEDEAGFERTPKPMLPYSSLFIFGPTNP